MTIQSKVALPRPMDLNTPLCFRIPIFTSPGQVSFLRPSLMFQTAHLASQLWYFKLRTTEIKHWSPDVSVPNSKFLPLRIKTPAGNCATSNRKMPLFPPSPSPLTLNPSASHGYSISKTLWNWFTFLQVVHYHLEPGVQHLLQLRAHPKTMVRFPWVGFPWSNRNNLKT